MSAPRSSKRRLPLGAALALMSPILESLLDPLAQEMNRRFQGGRSDAGSETGLAADSGIIGSMMNSTAEWIAGLRHSGPIAAENLQYLDRVEHSLVLALGIVRLRIACAEGAKVNGQHG